MCVPRPVAESLAAASEPEEAAASYSDSEPCPVEVVVTAVLSPDRFPEPMVCVPSYRGAPGAAAWVGGSPHAVVNTSSAAERIRIFIVSPWQEMSSLGQQGNIPDPPTIATTLGDTARRYPRHGAEHSVYAMVKPGSLNEPACAALGYLWDLDTRTGGYTRRCVRGWARREEIEAATGLHVPELLPRLRDRGLVDEVHVQVPGTRLVAVYRITALGDLLLARYQGREARPPWPAADEPGDEDLAVHIPPSPLVALRLLSVAYEDPCVSPLLPDSGPGWRTEEELWDQLEPELDEWLGEPKAGEWVAGDPPWRRAGPPASPPPVFGRSDLDWLERPGLVQRWLAPRPGRARPALLWRVTEAGLAVLPLEWHPPRDPEAV